MESFSQAIKPKVHYSIEKAVLSIDFEGSWNEEHFSLVQKNKKDVFAFINTKNPYSTVRIECKKMLCWDMNFLSFLIAIIQKIKDVGKDYSIENIDKKADKLLTLALAVPKVEHGKSALQKLSALEYIGEMALKIPESNARALVFMKDVYLSFVRLFTGKSFMYSRDLWASLYECSVSALGIISLTSLLLGLILAFVAVVQLSLFGTEVYVASFVGLSMVRIMGALLTGIIISGRTGASFAAIIGTMQVNEEVDALQTFGISAYDFLVLPRVISLVIMMPLLTLYANILGIIGGLIVAILIGIRPEMYMENLLEYMQLRYLWIGLFHAFTFGIVISLAGCYQGMRCGRSAEAVGQATTSAVVTSLVGIIVVTSIITIILSVLGL